MRTTCAAAGVRRCCRRCCCCDLFARPAAAPPRVHPLPCVPCNLAPPTPAAAPHAAFPPCFCNHRHALLPQQGQVILPSLSLLQPQAPTTSQTKTSTKGSGRPTRWRVRGLCSLAGRACCRGWRRRWRLPPRRRACCHVSSLGEGRPSVTATRVADPCTRRQGAPHLLRRLLLRRGVERRPAHQGPAGGRCARLPPQQAWYAVGRRRGSAGGQPIGNAPFFRSGNTFEQCPSWLHRSCGSPSIPATCHLQPTAAASIAAGGRTSGSTATACSTRCLLLPAACGAAAAGFTADALELLLGPASGPPIRGCASNAWPHAAARAVLPRVALPCLIAPRPIHPPAAQPVQICGAVGGRPAERGGQVPLCRRLAIRRAVEGGPAVSRVVSLQLERLGGASACMGGRGGLPDGGGGQIRG